MGSCCSKSSDHEVEADRGRSRTKSVRSGRQNERRVQQWKKTGLIILRDAGLQTLPSGALEVGESAKLLDVKGNKLSQLPPNLGIQLKKLNRLVVSENQLLDLQNILALQNLKTLIVDNNRLVHLPTEISSLSSLEFLDCTNNALQDLPSQLGELRALKYLKCGSNRIQSIPIELGNCSQLVELDASDNELREIPGSLSNLVNLTYLTLEGNLIWSLPSSVLQNCVSLHTIKLERNPITMAVFQELEGYTAYEERRRNKVNKQMAGGAVSNFDEGVARNTTQTPRSNL